MAEKMKTNKYNQYRIGCSVKVLRDTEKYQHCVGKYGVITEFEESDNNTMGTDGGDVVTVKFDFKLPNVKKDGNNPSNNSRWFFLDELEISKEYNIKRILAKIDGN